MASFNKVILMGHLTRDLETRTLPSGTVVCDLSLAVNRKWKDAQNQVRDEVLFVDCTAFGKRAETLAQYLHKGSPVLVEGRLKLERWEAEDTTHRSKIRVIIERFSFVGGGSPNATPATTRNDSRGKSPSPKRPTASKRRAVTAAEGATADIPF